MELRRFKNLLAMPLDSSSKRYLAFHSFNMDVAEVSAEAWESLAEQSPSEVLKELDAWSAEIDAETADAIEPRFINSLSINVAQVCNLKCGYCAAGGDGTYGSSIPNLDLSKIEKQLAWIAGQIPAGEVLNIHFLGGEPLLYPKAIAHIAKYVREFSSDRHFGLSFSITTNGTLINMRTAALLADLNCGVTISLDGDNEINDLNRPAKGRSTLSSTEMTLAGMKHLKNVLHQLAYIKINSVFGVHNTEVLKTYNFLRTLDLEIDGYNFNYANNAANETVTEKYLKEMEIVATQAFRLGGLTELAKFTQFRSALARVESKTRLNSYCGAGKSLLQIDTKHDLYPCNWFMGDKSEVVGCETELDQEKWNQFEDSLVKLNNCSSCWARHLCAGGCMAVHKDATGSKHQKDPLFCLRSRTLAAIAIRFYALTLLEGDQNEEHQKNPA